ncbi:MAG: DUF86 domain-containing protein [Deltaproteobacteria bacterium]|nr:DUF86 domain-containing protein [Deltaproteobacteria bacterium]MBN2671049.1 DUF86 domain-containing protein [Deltaproteobacteria bacterium]
MSIDSRDAAYLYDIFVAAKDVDEFVAGLTFGDFEQDKKCRYAVERQLLVIGEAANHLSEATTAANPEIPWAAMVGLRNIIAHDYGEILIERIWSNDE